MAKGFAARVLTTDDVQADYQALSARGVESTETPEERPTGSIPGSATLRGSSFR